MEMDARITFYNVGRCGFYPFGGKAPKFGGLADTFSQIEQWTRGKDLSLTKILDPAADADELPTYAMGITPSGGDWIFACLNEVPSHNGAVTSFAKNSPVGKPDIHQNELSPDTIPGYATYYWVVPERNVIATIKFSQTTSGLRALSSYVKNFLALESKYAISGNGPDEERVVGYTDQDDRVPVGVHPRFYLSPFAKAGRQNYLKANCQRIRKVIRKGVVSLEKVNDKTFFQTAVRFLHGDTTREHPVEIVRKAKIELEYTPTAAELDAMIAEDDQVGDAERWDDLGFELRDEAGIIWLGRSRASDTFALDVDVLAADIISAESLARAVAGSRAAILNLLNDD